MKTEIQFLIDILLEHKLPELVKSKFIARIGEVESRLTSFPDTIPRSSNGRTSGFGPENVGSIPARGTNQQSPSMQKILDEMAANGETLQSIQAAPVVQQRIIAPPEVVSSKGNGTMTRGPRKF